MQAADFEEFRSTLNVRLKKLWPKQHVDDELVQIYWRTLKDLTLPVFIRFVERHEKYGRTYPRPCDLRPREDKLPDVPGARDNSTQSKDADARCIRNLEKLKREDPAGWEREVAIRKMGQILAKESPGSSTYQAADNELLGLNAENGRWVKPR